MTVSASPALAPAAPVRLRRTRQLLIRLGAGLLTAQLLLNASAGPLAVASGKAPAALLPAALLAPVGKLLALGAVAAIAWTTGASALAVRLWVLGLVAEIAAALLVGSPADALAVLLQLVLFGGVLLLLLADRRRLLPGRPRFRGRFAPAAVLGAAAGVWIVLAARDAAASVPGLPADELAELRFDATLLGVALLGWWVVAGFLTSTRVRMLPVAGALLSAAGWLALPGRWADPGAVGVGLLLAAAVAAVLAAGVRGRDAAGRRP